MKFPGAIFCLPHLSAGNLVYARAPRVNFCFASAPAVSDISPTPSCSMEDAAIMYRNLDAPHRLCYGQMAHPPAVSRANSRSNPRRDRIFRPPKKSYEGVPLRRPLPPAKERLQARLKFPHLTARFAPFSHLLTCKTSRRALSGNGALPALP